MSGANDPTIGTAFQVFSDSIWYASDIVRGAISSAVEHYIDIVGVTGSIPVLPTMIFTDMQLKFNLFKHLVTPIIDWFIRLILT